MSVYPVCRECGLRREQCTDLSAHKRYVAWRADVNFASGRLRKTFMTKELADIQERQWKTDFERGLLLPKNNTSSKTFNDAASEWWTMAVGQNRIKDANTSEKYRVEMFKNLFGYRLLSSLKLEDAEEWLNQRLETGKAINTINRDMKPLKWILDYCVKKEYIKDNPFKELKQLKNGNIRIRWMDEAEIDLLLSKCDEVGDFSLKDLILVGVNTGFRKGNLERLTAKDIGEVRITASKTKSGRPYDVPISPALQPVINKLIQRSPTGPLLDTSGLDKRFRKVAKRAELYLGRANPENVTIHTLRHTFAALYLKRGGDIYKLSKLLGHSSIAITEKVYAHICPKELDAQATLIGTSIKEPIFKVV